MSKTTSSAKPVIPNANTNERPARQINIVQAAMFTPMLGGDWGLPLILWGEPGTTKTANIKALFRRFGLHCEHLAPGERGDGAFGVTPVPTSTPHGTVLSYPMPDWALLLRNAESGEEAGGVFFDEINTAPPALQPALLGGIQERRIGGHRFGGRVRPIGAANPTGQSAGGWDISPPVANRCGHIDWKRPEVEDFTGWLLSGASSGEEEKVQDAKKEEARVMKAWPEAFAKASGLVSAFLRARSDLLHKMPPENDPKASRAWPSSRTWEYATRALASSMVHGLVTMERDEFIAAFVGAGPGGELATFMEENDLPEPAKLLDGEIQFQHDPERLDRTVVVLNACAALVTPKEAAKRNDRGEALWKMIGAISEDAKDVVVPSMTSLVTAQLKTASAKPIMARLHSVVTTAGAL